ncbi:MAG TPA: flagellin [Bryobacteraceae bacterium]
MSFSILTNTASLQAQQYLNANQAFQSKTIQQVTSGLRIVNSGDDAAGLAIANGDRSTEAVLTQGILNANDGLSQLQIVDGGINNISQLLDRASTLATQSASGTFTGNRAVLDSEFQSVVSEINREAQSIGLSQGGALAQNLQVFIGGGESNNGITAINNGSVSLNLSKSTVDAQSLGLVGVQAIGVAGTDIGSGSANTSLSSILANATNANTTSQAGFTTFIVKGPGFADNGVTVSVNTSNLGGTSDLVTAVNAAISAAANGGTQAATALKNANISASINTDSTGKQQLVFSSSTAAFQVQAGDREANALLGNFAQNAVATSTDNNAYVDTSAGGAAKQLTLAIDGGTAFTVNVTQGVGTSKGQIVDDLNSYFQTNSVGASASLNGNQLVITSNGNSSASAVTVTGTTLSTALGLTSATASSASTGSAVTTTVQGANAVAAGANLIGTTTGATATIASTSNTVILTVGNSAAQTLTLANVGTETKAEIAADINTQIAANTHFTAANAAQVTASVVNNQIVLTAASPGSAITLGAGTANTALGFTTAETSDTHTATTADTINLRFQGSGLTSPIDVTLTPTVAGTTTSANVLADLQSQIAGNSALQAAGITLSTGSLGNNLVFTSSKGEQFQVQATGDSQNLLGLGSFVAGSGNNVTDYNTITAGAAYSTGIAGGSGTADLQVSLNGLASSPNQISVNLSGAGTDATAASTTGATAASGTGIFVLTGATGTLNLVLDGTHAFNVNLGSSATTTAITVASDITTALGAAGSASVNSAGKIVINSATTGANSSVEVLATSDTVYTAALGLTTGSAGQTRGANASEANVINQINTAIAGNTSLTNAGLQATDNGAGSISLVSNNNTYFRVNSFGSGNIGFGNLGASFTGNAQSAAPTTSQYFDSQGAAATSELAYSDTLYGSDNQTLAVTGVDSTGTKHSIGVTLQNNSSAREQTIDQAINQINTQLQQSNDPSLQSIVAVKDNTNGVQSIRFLSTLSSFQVSVGSDAGGTGITPPTGNVSNSSTLGVGLTASVGSQTNAEAAVNALAKAVTLLGNAQAVVGRGENQFNYAVNLAQSQLTNVSAAESGIRDADLASAAANLTKAQILVQAGVAALAQANSAPQQILSLLKS